jgi:alanyl-tRNA synthetase
MKELQSFARELRAEMGSGVIALGLDADEPQLFVTVSQDLVERGVSAGRLVQTGAPQMDGRGGGKPDMAQARGTRRDRLPQAFDAIRRSLATAVGDGSGDTPDNEAS